MFVESSASLSLSCVLFLFLLVQARRLTLTSHQVSVWISDSAAAANRCPADVQPITIIFMLSDVAAPCKPSQRWSSGIFVFVFDLRVASSVWAAVWLPRMHQRSGTHSLVLQREKISQWLSVEMAAKLKSFLSCRFRSLTCLWYIFCKRLLPLSLKQWWR